MAPIDDDNKAELAALVAAAVGEELDRRAAVDRAELAERIADADADLAEDLADGEDGTAEAGAAADDAEDAADAAEAAADDAAAADTVAEAEAAADRAEDAADDAAEALGEVLDEVLDVAPAPPDVDDAGAEDGGSGEAPHLVGTNDDDTDPDPAIQDIAPDRDHPFFRPIFGRRDR